MSRQIILSIVGEQTIPLVQFIKALSATNEYWFVETKRIRDLQCVPNIMKACDLSENQVRRTLVQPDALTFIPLKDWVVTEQDTLYLNLTSATKPMMLSIFRYYQSFPTSRHYYIPIESAKALPVEGHWPDIELPLLSLVTYLLALGFTYTYAEPDMYLQKKAVNVFSKVSRKGNAGLVPVIQKAKKEYYTGNDKKWLSGEWWEDYLYYILKSGLNLQDNQIAQGVRLEYCLSQSTTDSDNELDIAFVYQNRLYVIEGKVYNGIARGDKITNPIYKLGTIIKALGLRASGIVCLCANITASKDQIQRLDYLKRISGVKTFLTLKDFKEGIDFKKVIN